MSYLEGRSIGEAYVKALESMIKNKVPHWYLTIHISRPIRDTEMEHKISSHEIKDWLDIINVEDKVFQAFSIFRFSKVDAWTGGNTGEDWINGRIKDLLHPDGYYNKALRSGYSFDQLKEVEERLCAKDKRGRKMHGGGTNALVCHVFLPHEDLKKACLPRPRASGLRCLAMIDFKPERDNLNLMAVFRSQYFDTKAYGNFIALAILLYKMCQKTGYNPGAIVSTANKITFDGHENSLYQHLKRMGVI
jgi:thymidylate synthase